MRKKKDFEGAKRRRFEKKCPKAQNAVEKKKERHFPFEEFGVTFQNEPSRSRITKRIAV